MTYLQEYLSVEDCVPKNKRFPLIFIMISLPHLKASVFYFRNEDMVARSMGLLPSCLLTGVLGVSKKAAKCTERHGATSLPDGLTKNKLSQIFLSLIFFTGATTL
jgi:hypothetical protein